MPEVGGHTERGRLAGWVVLTQLRAAALVLGLLTKPSRMKDAGRIVERGCRSALLKRFPLFAGRMSIMDQTALCARAAGVLKPQRRALVQSMMMLWLVRTRSYAAQLIDLESLDALRFAPDAKKEQQRAATMAGRR